MMGQANALLRYLSEKIQPAMDRYQNEGRRLFEVLNGHLDDRARLAGDFSIADFANWCWVRTHRWSGIRTDGLDRLKAWMGRLDARPDRPSDAPSDGMTLEFMDALERTADGIGPCADQGASLGD